MKIYTKTGDAGETGLFGGARVSKASDRVEAYGNVDELNSVIGFARSFRLGDKVDTILEAVQNELFQVGAELGSVPEKQDKLSLPVVTDEHVAVLERGIDALEEGLEPLRAFILPGGDKGASALHIARCVCRRAERSVIALHRSEPVRGELVRYLNRLSDFLFVAARHANKTEGVADVEWEGKQD